MDDDGRDAAARIGLLQWAARLGWPDLNNGGLVNEREHRLYPWPAGEAGWRYEVLHSPVSRLEQIEARLTEWMG